MEQQAAPDPLAFRRLVWISFVIALVVYGVIGILVFGPDARDAGLPSWLLPLVAAALGTASLLVPRAMSDQQARSRGMRVAEIVGWGLAESVGIAGLVSVALGGSTGGLVLYLAAALVLLVVQAPRESQIA